MTVFQPSNPSINTTVKLDPSLAAFTTILGGRITSSYVVVFLKQAGLQFIQVHQSNVNTGLVGLIDSYVKNFAVLDLVQEKDLFFVYAIRQAGQTNQISVLAIKSETESFQVTSSYSYINLDGKQCADRLEVSISVIAVSCLSTKTISIYRRKTMEKLF